MRAARWVWLPLLFMPLLLPTTSLLPSLLDSDPRPVPGDLCAPVPAALLDRVVPARKVESIESENRDYANRATCNVSTDSEQAASTAQAYLSIELVSHGGWSSSSAESRAQDDFASMKQYRLTDDGPPRYRIADVRRIGDSAYAGVREADEYHRQQRRSSLLVAVLRDDVELMVHYGASPTTDDLALSAAVAVTRALLGGLR